MWTLLLSKQGGAPGGVLDRRQLDAGSIRIGRSAQLCDWVVDDASGEISREHCTVSAVGLDLFVIDTSANGTSLNDPANRIAPQVPVPIRVNDRLLIGGMMLQIVTDAQGAAARLTPASLSQPASPATGGLGDPNPWGGAVDDPVWNIGQQASEGHEFLSGAIHDFLQPPSAMPPTPGGYGGALSAAFSKPILAELTPSPNAFFIPEDWASSSPAAPASPPGPAPADPFAALAGQPLPPAIVDPLVPAQGNPFAPSPAGDPFAPLPPGADPFAPKPGDDPFAAAPVNDPFAPLPGGNPFAPLPTDDPFGVSSPAPAAPVPAAVDPFALPAGGLLDSGTPPSPGASPPPATPSPERTRIDFGGSAATGLASLPPLASPAPPPPPPLVPTVPTPAVDAEPPGEAWAAFCQGAEIAPADLRLAPDAMRRLGVLYRQMVLGLTDLIQDRAAFKEEFRVNRTQVSFGRNNPLKYLSASEAAKLLLGEPMPGFMSGEEAVRSALGDIKRHQLAMLAGVQQALEAVFARLSPSEIERVMEKAAANARGKLFGRGGDPWVVYQAVFEALRKDATANADSVMSVAFREGYETFLRNAA